ncbi:MAG: NYN domain-containing protein [Chloroflexi bacterium]|nr:NYN domain-containing protein [Chloroflexota bacterium]
MLQSNSQQGGVGLFIDWDNLAISIAEDMNGAVPDPGLIIQRAQQYGQVLVARAYAEWQASSERLAVYKAGVEPVYAPTFRYDQEQSATSKSKSLADPVMVTDCIDTLHLLPSVSTFVIVTGDKDLVPVARLAKLRGKRVVVIGPDYAAVVLREVADEFISYRQLLGEAHAKLTGEPISRRPMPPRPRPQIEARPPEPRPERTPPKPIAAGPVVAPPPPAPTEVKEKETAGDLGKLATTIREILETAAQQGKMRLRATFLKNELMKRIPGFTERTYGYHKFKDLLTAAERAGYLALSQVGQVHWISQAEPAMESQPAVAPSLAPIAEPPPAPTGEQLAQDQDALVRFMVELKRSSNWLTYTYVLSNLTSHLGRAMSSSEADRQARATLDSLVSAGALRIDREPQSLEVGGVTHRVRMCYLDEEHPLVRHALGQAAEATPTVETTEAVELPQPQPSEEPSAAQEAIVAETPSMEEAASVEVEEHKPKRASAPRRRRRERPAKAEPAAMEGTPTQATEPPADRTIPEPKLVIVEGETLAGIGHGGDAESRS